MESSKEDQLRDLDQAILNALILKVKSGKASAQDLKVALDYIKHNGVVIHNDPGLTTDLLDEIERALEDQGKIN